MNNDKYIKNKTIKLSLITLALFYSIACTHLPRNENACEVFWEITNDTLFINGTGAMPDYYYFSDSAPWLEYNNLFSCVVIENGITSIGDFSFYYCTNLKSITIPNSVTSIGEYAFAGRSRLRSVKIPASVTSIEYGAFLDCNDLVEITNYARTPQPILYTSDECTSCGIDKTKCILRVPDAAVSAYRTAEVWGDFRIIEALKIDNTDYQLA